MIVSPQISPEIFRQRVPFMKRFTDFSTKNKIYLRGENFNNNVSVMVGDSRFTFEHLNIFIDFVYYIQKIRNEFIHTVILEPKLIYNHPDNMPDTLFGTINVTIQKKMIDLSLHIESESHTDKLIPDELNAIVNDLNKTFFKLEEFLNMLPFDIKTPLDESYKSIITEHLRNFSEDVKLPQDYNDEFNQTGSGKSIQGKPNLPNASKLDVAKIRAKITQAHQIAKAYREAYQKGLNVFDVIWQGTQYHCKIPKGFREKTNVAGEKTDYLYYFDYPNVGDGGFQVSMDKTGFMRAKHIRAKSDMDQNPRLAAATDAGYQKDYEGRSKYFFVQAGVRGKFQEDGYSVFPSPAMDAAVKTLISFQTDIIDFMSGALGYTSDAKGKDLANEMNLEDKIKKVRLDAERILNVDKSLAFNPIWTSFREGLLKKYAGPTSVFKFDIDSEVEAFVELFKKKNLFNHSGKPELSMPQDELDAWEKEQKEKLARLAAARARRNH